MARERSPNRDKAFEIWRDSGGKMPLKTIAEQLGVSDTQIRKWKNQDNWEERLNGNVTNDLNSNVTIAKNKGGAPKGNQNAKGHGAPTGNQNALGNRGGNGPPLGSKNALKTGEYETIWFDTLTDEEKVLYGKIDTGTLAQVEQGIIFLSYRERRMMERIRKLMDGLTENEKVVLSELRDDKQVMNLYDEKTGINKEILVPLPRLMITKTSVTHFRAIDDILRLEDALTRVQEKKARYIALKHTIETAAKAEGGDVAKDHARRLQEAWANRC